MREERANPEGIIRACRGRFYPWCWEMTPGHEYSTEALPVQELGWWFPPRHALAGRGGSRANFCASQVAEMHAWNPAGVDTGRAAALRRCAADPRCRGNFSEAASASQCEAATIIE